MIEFEDFIPLEIQNELEKIITSSDFPWYMTSTIDDRYLDNGDRYVFNQGINPQQFSHNLVVNFRPSSDYTSIMNPILDSLVEKLRCKIEVERVKVNLLLKHFDNTHHTPHVDVEVEDYKNIKSLIYYVNDSDGDTYFFKETAPRSNEVATVMKQITPKKGKAVMFNVDNFHASSSPVSTNYRIVLNIVFKILE
jgi:hypothetical protein